MTSARNSSIELYRIIVMLAIVAHHYVCNFPLMGMGVHNGGGHLFCARNVFFVLLGAWGQVGINCFVLITGYFMCQSAASVRKFLKLYLEVVFYSLFCNAAFVLSGYAPFAWDMVVDGLFPFKAMTDGFVAAFLAFYLFIPFLNVLITNLSRRWHLLLVCALLSVFSLSSVFKHYRVNIDYVEWFCVVYIIGAYLRLHSNRWMENRKAIGLLLMVALGASVCSIVAFEFLIPGGYNYFLLADSNKPLAVIVAILAFLWFRNLKLPYNRWINLIASATFGVFLLHANSDLMRQWLWSDVCHTLDVYHSGLYWVVAPLSVGCVFAVTAGIDLIRQKLIEKPLMRRIGK